MTFSFFFTFRIYQYSVVLQKKKTGFASQSHAPEKRKKYSVVKLSHVCPCWGIFGWLFHGQAFYHAWSFRSSSFNTSRRKKEEGRKREKGKMIMLSPKATCINRHPQPAFHILQFPMRSCYLGVRASCFLNRNWSTGVVLANNSYSFRSELGRAPSQTSSACPST